MTATQFITQKSENFFEKCDKKPTNKIKINKFVTMI